MKTWQGLTGSILAVALTAGAAAEGFKVYPGAVKYTPPDTEETRQFTSNLRPGTTITAYLTNDSFDQVVAFYKGLAKEYENPGMHAAKLPDGQEVRKAFLIFDGASNLVKSKLWISVQHPFVASVTLKGGEPQYGDIRDLTEIVLTEKKDVHQDKP